MSIKDRVLALMKTSYSKYGFKKEELNQLADIISVNLTEKSSDEDITTTLTANEGYAKMVQSVYNRGVSETNEKYRDYIPKPKDTVPPTNQQPPKQDPPKGLTAEEIQKLVSDGIAEGLKPYKEQAERERLKALLSESTKLKDVPKIFRDRYTLDKEDNLDSVIERINADWTSVKQGLVQNGVMVEAPKKGDPNKEDDDFRKMMEESSKRIAEKQTEQQQAAHKE